MWGCQDGELNNFLGWSVTQGVGEELPHISSSHSLETPLLPALSGKPYRMGAGGGSGDLRRGSVLQGNVSEPGL